MARIFITGSADGLGMLAGELLISRGHRVVLHARNQERGDHIQTKIPDAEKILIGDLASVDQIKKLAQDVNALGKFDAIIHNAGVYQVSGKIIFTVNSLAPYILTCLIQKPNRLVYMSSGMHKSGDASLKYFDSDQISYSDSKLHNVILSMFIARKWPDVYSNAVNPGWVPTKMGGRGAPDDLGKGVETQAWLAVSNDGKAKVSGRYFKHKKEESYRKEADDIGIQDKYIEQCEKVSGVSFPS